MGANYFEATVKWLPKLFRNMVRALCHIILCGLYSDSRNASVLPYLSHYDKISRRGKRRFNQSHHYFQQ
ncbi:hypothetical protein RchiOBHm_Chr5g0004181 [Rosa chinensis]|uniref:Uncharacterized protein n=1 Tax=Rosa chinensis TaxID=74649 RepID=A0A2P6Q2Z6_ROSCH|nr:hypothetical protein RchiOBHm_Chr5g0004181 [Rosa chinensis]